jgi:hypothetical protein
MGVEYWHDGILLFDPPMMWRDLIRLDQHIENLRAQHLSRMNESDSIPYVDFTINDQGTGIIRDNTCEKYRESCEALNFLLISFRGEMPTFGLSGVLWVRNDCDYFVPCSVIKIEGGKAAEYFEELPPLPPRPASGMRGFWQTVRRP